MGFLQFLLASLLCTHSVSLIPQSRYTRYTFTATHKPLHAITTIIDEPLDKNFIKVINRLPIRFSLPTNDVTSAELFLLNPSQLVECLWDSGKYKLIDSNNGVYVLECKAISFPVLGTFNPEIRIQILPVSESLDTQQSFKTLEMCMRKINSVEVIQFQSLRITFEGLLCIPRDTININSNVVIDGFVEYKIEGVKPRYVFFYV